MKPGKEDGERVDSKMDQNSRRIKIPAVAILYGEPYQHGQSDLKRHGKYPFRDSGQKKGGRGLYKRVGCIP